MNEVSLSKRGRFPAASSPAQWLDVQVVSLVGALDEAETGDVVEGVKTSLDDGHLTRACDRKITLRMMLPKTNMKLMYNIFMLFMFSDVVEDLK